MPDGGVILGYVAGASQGHQDVRTTITAFVEAFDFIHRDIISITIDGDRAAVHSRIKVRFIPGDKTVTTDILNSFRFKDGKIIELVEFADTALIINAPRVTQRSKINRHRFRIAKQEGE
ncbi:putative SnoaL-like aldol condensation-catalyzing enzyme [Nitrobacteraceae bacterium AZCC 2146]